MVLFQVWLYQTPKITIFSYYNILISVEKKVLFKENSDGLSSHKPNIWLYYWNIKIWELFAWRLLKKLRNQQTFSWKKTSIDWLKSKAFILIVFFYSCEKNGDPLVPIPFLYYRWLTWHHFIRHIIIYHDLLCFLGQIKHLVSADWYLDHQSITLGVWLTLHRNNCFAYKLCSHLQ